jgi:hypothetical protein
VSKRNCYSPKAGAQLSFWERLIFLKKCKVFRWYTVIESCRRRGIDPYAYLEDGLSRLPRMTNHQIPEVTPAAWLAEQKRSEGCAKALLPRRLSGQRQAAS